MLTVWGVGPPLHDLPELDLASFLNENSLPGQDIHDVPKAELLQGDRFRRKKVVCGSWQGGRRTRTKAERTDTVCVSTFRFIWLEMMSERQKWINLPEAQDTEACQHRGARKRPLALRVYLTQRSEDVVCVGASLSELIEAVCKNVETRERWVSKPQSRRRCAFTPEMHAQELRVRVRVDVPPGFHVQELAEVLGVHKVAVDAHREPEW